MDLYLLKYATLVLICWISKEKGKWRRRVDSMS